MSKTKNKSGSETEHLRGVIKQLKSENNSLKRRLRQLEKREHFFEYEESSDSEEITKNNSTCENCGKGEYKYIDLGRVAYLVCPICSNRKKA